MVGFSGKGGLVDHIAPDKDKAALFQMIDFRPDKIAPLSFEQIIDFIVIIVDMYVRHCILKIPDDPADIQANTEVLSLLFLGHPEGVREGTLAAAVCVGLVARQTNKIMKKAEAVILP